MQFLYETERLVLRVLDATFVDHVLLFYLENKETFEKYEAKRPENFYTANYQCRVLSHEYNAAVNRTNIRFWVYEKSNLNQIIGTVCLRDITRTIYQSCEIGYKFDERHWHHGYATESLFQMISVAFDDLRLHRIVAKIMPENIASIQLVTRLGFEYEGIARQSAMVRGVWEDHAIYSLLSSYAHYYDND